MSKVRHARSTKHCEHMGTSYCLSFLGSSWIRSFSIPPLLGVHVLGWWVVGMAISSRDVGAISLPHV